MKKLTKLIIGAMFIAGMTVVGANGPLGDFTNFTKWQAGAGTTVTKSTEHKTTGENSTKITIATTDKYPGILLENKGVFNLSNATTMSFDCFNAGDKVKFVLKLKSPGKKFSKKFVIPAGQNKISIPLSEMKIDMSAVRYIKIWTKKPGKEIVLYLDNLVFE